METDGKGKGKKGMRQADYPVDGFIGCYLHDATSAHSFIGRGGAPDADNRRLVEEGRVED